MAPRVSNSKSLSCTIPGDLYDKLDDHKWKIKKNMSEAVAAAITVFLISEGVIPDPNAPVADEPAAEVESDEVPSTLPKPKGK